MAVHNQIRKTMTLTYKIPTVLFLLLAAFATQAQQDPQVTHYQYNTMTVNPAYTGSRVFATITSLYRDQWAGIDGSPRTMTFGIDTPVGKFDGLGLSIVQDGLGPSEETYIDGNYAHQLILNKRGHRLALGLKAGIRFFSLDWSKGRFRDEEAVFNQNIEGKILPSIGAGAFFYTDNSYFGVSTPNFLTNQHYDEIQEAEATEQIRLFIIGGYVFDLNADLKFKPSFFVKQVFGAPVAVDISSNFLLYEKLNFGVNYRWDESISGLFSFQISDRFNLGYAYDFNVNELNNYNSGTHEIFLRYSILNRLNRLKSPRFF